MKAVGRFPVPALAWFVAVSGLSAKEIVSEVAPPESATVSADRVNVRARASLIGERVTQLRKGDQVTVLAKLTVAPPRDGEPADWLRITMPAAGQTWVNIGFVKEGKVTATGTYEELVAAGVDLAMAIAPPDEATEEEGGAEGDAESTGGAAASSQGEPATPGSQGAGRALKRQGSAEDVDAKKADAKRSMERALKNR